jgi:hypothetical protein
VLFKDESGISSEAQIAIFDDTWHWGKIHFRNADFEPKGEKLVNQ